MDFVLPNNPTKKDLVEGLNTLFTVEEWTTHEPFTLDNLKERVGKPKIENPTLFLIAAYLQNRTLKRNPHPITKEIMEWEGRNQFCMHINLLAYTLLKQLAPRSEVAYFQGLSELKTNDVFSAMLFGETQYGIHAWIEVDGAIIDFSGEQFIHGAELDNTANFILGEPPANLKFIGKSEPQAIVEQYVERIAESQQLTKMAWSVRILSDFSSFLDTLK